MENIMKSNVRTERGQMQGGTDLFGLVQIGRFAVADNVTRKELVIEAMRRQAAQRKKGGGSYYGKAIAYYKRYLGDGFCDQLECLRSFDDEVKGSRSVQIQDNRHLLRRLIFKDVLAPCEVIPCAHREVQSHGFRIPTRPNLTVRKDGTEFVLLIVPHKNLVFEPNWGQLSANVMREAACSRSSDARYIVVDGEADVFFSADTDTVKAKRAIAATMSELRHLWDRLLSQQVS